MAEESAAIERSLLESNEVYAAFKIYISWLESDGRPALRRVGAEIRRRKAA